MTTQLRYLAKYNALFAARELAGAATISIHQARHFRTAALCASFIAAHLHEAWKVSPEQVITGAEFYWVPEAPNYPGTYAPMNYVAGKNTATNMIEEAMLFNEESECLAWCQQNQYPRYKPQQHGFGADTHSTSEAKKTPAVIASGLIVEVMYQAHKNGYDITVDGGGKVFVGAEVLENLEKLDLSAFITSKDFQKIYYVGFEDGTSRIVDEATHQELTAPAVTLLKKPIVEAEQAAEKQSLSLGLTAPRLTPADIDKAIASEEFAIFGGRLTLCVLHLVNGGMATGESYAVSVENFDKGRGEQYSREAARRKVWELEGYALKDRLYQQGNFAQAAVVSQDMTAGYNYTHPED